MVKDGRSKRAIAIDKAKQAMKVYPRTPDGLAAWAKHKGSADLERYDTSHKVRTLDKWAGQRRSKAEYEFASRDTIDMDALLDTSLGRREAKRQLKHDFRDYMF